MPRKSTAPTVMLDTRAAAKYVGLAESTLEKMRVYRHLDGPPFVSLNSRIVYRIADLDAWIASRTFRSTRQRDRSLGKSRKPRCRKGGGPSDAKEKKDD